MGMNKVLMPKVVFKDIESKEARIESVYKRIFEKAQRNILEKKQLTSDESKEYTEVHYE